MNTSRIVAFATGSVLLGFSLWWIPDASIPVPRYRSGTYADYLLAAKLFLAVHGGVLLGVIVYWVNRQRVGRKMNPMGIFKSGLIAELCISLGFLLVSAIHGLIALGSLEKGIGNLWGATIVLWLVLGTIVAAAVALLFYGVSGRRIAS